MPANQPYGLEFWRDEIARSERIAEPLHSKWETNLKYYTGDITDKPTPEFVNVNVDFYETEQKGGQLFYDTPELQLAPGAGFEPTMSGVIAFRRLLNVILGSDYIDALETVNESVNRCMITSGHGATIIGYQPTLSEVSMTPQPGAVLDLSRPVQVPIHEAWFWDEIPDKKFLKPADFHSTNFDKAPWLGMAVRLPLRAARSICNLPPDFEGTRTRDEKVLETTAQAAEDSAMAYVDLVLVWYKAYLFDDDEIHPEIYRRHIIVNGLDAFADKDDPAWRSPYQTKLPNGRLRADSMIGNPIHVFTLRSVPDSSCVPSDAKMRRDLVEEYCGFRGQMVAERDINKPKFAYNAEVIPPDAIAKIESAMTGSLIPLPAAAFAGGLDSNFRLISQGTSPRQTYLANDYIATDLAKTSGMDAAGVGVNDENEETATKTAEVARARGIRIGKESKRIIRQYLKGVDKVAALVLRFCSDPARVTELIGPQSAQTYLQWREAILQAGDPRPKFTAKPDSHLKLDAAAERKWRLDVYNFMAKDPLFNRGAWIRKIVALTGEDPAEYIAEQQPESKPEPSLGWSFKGEDLNPLMPQFPIVLEALAQMGIQISPQSLKEAQDGALNASMMQQAMPTPAGEKAATKKPAPHGGLAEKAGQLSKQDSEMTGARPGPSVQ